MKQFLCFLILLLIPIPSAAESLKIKTHDGQEINLQFDSPVLQDNIVRSPGPSHYYHCLMCLYNHLVGTHGQASEYLNRNGYAAWPIIHDNLHNDPSFTGERGRGYYTGYNLPAGRYPVVSSFAPTPLDVCENMLEMAHPTEQDIIYDLGCGDGRFLVMAALKYNCRAVGLEIDKRCVELTRKYIARYGLQDKVVVYHRDATKTPIPEASIVVMYLMPKQSAQMKALIPDDAKVIVHDMAIDGWGFSKMDSMMSREDGKEHRMFLYDEKRTRHYGYGVFDVDENGKFYRREQNAN